MFDTHGSNFDTLLAVYTGSSVGSLTLVASNDDENPPTIVSSKVTFTAQAGTAYQIAVDGFAGDSGTIVLNWAPVASLQFSVATYSVNENGGSATVTVTRTGGSAGAVGVTVATSNGTATAGADYTATTQTVTWANGDTSNKSVSIPILDDSVIEGNETVNLTLSNPTGGATLGSPGTAVLTIIDNDSATGNDNFANRISLSGTSGQITGTNVGATKDRKSTRLNSSHSRASRMPSSA